MPLCIKLCYFQYFSERDVDNNVHLFVTVYIFLEQMYCLQGCIFRLTCSHPELTKDHVLTSAYVNIFRAVTRNAVNKGV